MGYITPAVQVNELKIILSEDKRHRGSGCISIVQNIDLFDLKKKNFFLVALISFMVSHFGICNLFGLFIHIFQADMNKYRSINSSISQVPTHIFLALNHFSFAV